MTREQKIKDVRRLLKLVSEYGMPEDGDKMAEDILSIAERIEEPTTAADLTPGNIFEVNGNAVYYFSHYENGVPMFARTRCEIGSGDAVFTYYRKLDVWDIIRKDADAIQLYKEIPGSFGSRRPLGSLIERPEGR